MVARRLRGEPMAYVVGETGFRHLMLTVDHRALIPRPESEGVVEHALARVREGRAVDLGTGSGCLALSLRQEGSFGLIVGVDLSPEALSLAAENRRRTGQAIELVRGDLGEPVRDAAFDLVVSNPPYLTEAEYQGLDRSVRGFEPRLALESGAQGLTASRRVLGHAARLLRAGGWLVMELDSSRAALLADMAAGAGWRDVRVFPDLFERSRYLTACRG